jgi:hypothetical protein
MRRLTAADDVSVPRRKRPPLYWKTLAIGGPALVGASVLLAIDGLVWLALTLFSLGLAVFFLPWLLSPYSNVARRIAWPTAKDFERSERSADWLGSLPLFGVVWRWAERVTGDAGRRSVEDYRRWQREHDDEGPT